MGDFKRNQGGGGGRSPPLQEVAAEKIKVASAWLRDYITAIKKGNLHPFSTMERKVREATRNEAWGPTGTLLNDLAEASHNSTDCEIIFAVIQFRLGYPPEKWRNVYKALVVLDFLMQRGSEQSVELTKEELAYKLADLESFAFTTPEGKDQGVNIRHRAKAVRELLLDGERLVSVRQSYQRKRKAYQGYSRDQLAPGKGFHDDQDIPSPQALGRSGSIRRTLSESSMQGSPTAFVPTQQENFRESSQIRNAGETKGVTMEMNKKQLAELKRLLDLPQNRYCADCVGGGGAARASWASINTGVFICMQCAGAHRGLGTHVSQVRSCSLDTWLPAQVTFMQQTGNDRANEFFEAKMDPSWKPAYGSADIASFVRRKYANRQYAGDGIWPPIMVRSAEAEEVQQTAAVPPAAQLEDDDLAPDPETSAAPNSYKRGQPRLTGTSRGQRQATFKPLTRLVSVPIPRTSSTAATEPQQPVRPVGRPVFDLMDLDPLELTQQPTDPTFEEERDVFADLRTLEPAISQMHHASQSSLNTGTDSSQQTAVPPQDSFTAWPALNLPLPQHLPPAAPASGQWTPTGGGFHEESVKDWGLLGVSEEMDAALERTKMLRLHSPSLSLAGDEFMSTSSTPMFTPRMSKLLGPGPGQNGWQRPQRQAAAPYLPFGPTPKYRPMGALGESAKQWAANSNKGKTGVLDDLVLHAIAGLPDQPEGGVIDALRAAQAPKPVPMSQQRAELSL